MVVASVVRLAVIQVVSSADTYDNSTLRLILKALMAATQYIPIGLTSQVTGESVTLQIQTEYATRPYHRVTSTITDAGRVVRKVESKLPGPVTSPEEQQTAERLIRKQHGEIVSLIRDSGLPGSNSKPTVEPMSETKSSLETQIRSVTGVQRVFVLNRDGDFVGGRISREFRKAFAPIFRNMSELLQVFQILPGGGGSRESGVYEVERDHLYLISTGLDFFFVVAESSDGQSDSNMEKRLIAVVNRYA